MESTDKITKARIAMAALLLLFWTTSTLFGGEYLLNPIISMIDYGISFYIVFINQRIKLKFLVIGYQLQAICMRKL